MDDSDNESEIDSRPVEVKGDADMENGGEDEEGDDDEEAEWVFFTLLDRLV